MSPPLWPISPKDYAFFCNWTSRLVFQTGIYLRLANKTYLAIHLCNYSCLISQMRAQPETPKGKVGSPTFIQDFGISRNSSRTGPFSLSTASLELHLVILPFLVWLWVFLLKRWFPRQLNVDRSFFGEPFFHWPNIEIIQLSLSKKYVITFFPPNSLSHWIWELDKIKFLGDIHLRSGQILCCSTVSGNIFIYLDRRQCDQHPHRGNCMRSALSRAALGYFKVTISKWEQNCVIRF